MRRATLRGTTKGQGMHSSRHSFVAVAAGLALVVGLASMANAQARHTPFMNQSTESLQGVGEYTSLALDGTGRTHVAWFDAGRGALAYAVQTPLGWRTEVVDASGKVGWYASLALDSRSHEGIAYYDITNGALKFASHAGGSWTTQTVEASPDGARVPLGGHRAGPRRTRRPRSVDGQPVVVLPEMPIDRKSVV